jgi:PKD repeat protein
MKRGFSFLFIFLAISILLLFNPFIPSVKAAITRVQGNARGTSTTGSTVVATFTGTPSDQNNVFAVIWLISAKTISSIAETGVTWDKYVSMSIAISGANLSIWRGVVGVGAGTAVTVTLSGSLAANEGVVLDVCEYVGNFTIDKTASASGPNSYTGATGTTDTTSVADELWIGTIGGSSSNNCPQSSPTNGFTLLDGASFYRQGNVYYMCGSFLEKIVTATATAYCGVTFPVPTNYWGCIATFTSSIPSPWIATLYFNTGANSVTMNGTAYGNGSTWNLGATVNHTVTFGFVITVNYAFMNWTYDGSYSTANPFSLQFNANYTVWLYLMSYTEIYALGNSSGYTLGYSDGYTVGYADGLGNATGGAFIYARFTMNDTAPYQDQDTVFFNASSSNSSAMPLTYYWDFGDTNVSTGETTTHIYVESGVFTINLTVVNGLMSDQIFQNITVFATSINVSIDWNDLLFGSGAWIPLIIVIAVFFVLVTWNKYAVVAALPVMSILSLLYFTNSTTTTPLIWHALIMFCSAIVLLIYSAAKK